MLPSSCRNIYSSWSPPPFPDSDDGEHGDISDITATANTPATPAMHPPIKLRIFPILSSLGMISSVIEGLPYNFEYGDRNRYGWSPTHKLLPPIESPSGQLCRAWFKRMILSGGPKIGPSKHLGFIMPPFLWLK
jgi:hypothetical protein